jgi:Tetracyclin repressor-like, C-terminal domain
VSEAQSDPELATAFRDRWLLPRRKGVHQNIKAAILEGSLRDDFNIDTAIDQLYGSLYCRLLLGSGLPDEQFIEDTYQQFLIGHQSRLAVWGTTKRRACFEESFETCMSSGMLLDWCQNLQSTHRQAMSPAEHLVANCTAHSVAAYRFIQHRRAKKQTMEMTGYGKP